MKYMKALSLFMILIMVVSAFAACGKKTSESTESTTTASTETEEPSAFVEGEVIKIPSTNQDGIVPDDDELEIMTVPQGDKDTEEGDTPVESETNTAEIEEEIPSFDIENIINGTGPVELPFVPAN